MNTDRQNPKKKKRLTSAEAFRLAAAREQHLRRAAAPPPAAAAGAPSPYAPPVPAAPAPSAPAAPAAPSGDQTRPAAAPQANAPHGVPVLPPPGAPTAPQAAARRAAPPPRPTRPQAAASSAPSEALPAAAPPAAGAPADGARKKGPKSDMPRIEQIRRRKQQRHLRRAALLLAVLIAAFLYLGGVFSSSINLLSDLLDSARIALFAGSGWPVSLLTEDVSAAVPLGGGIALCGSSELAIYSPTAKLLRTVQHGYAEPGLAAGNARVCVYNRSGKELRVESRSRTLSSWSTEYPILTVGMSPDGAMAVATRSERYLAEIAVYDPNFNNIYTAYLADNYPLSVALSHDGRRMAAACLSSADGSLGTRLLLYDLTSTDESTRLSLDVADAVPLQLHFAADGSLVVIYDSFAAVYNAADGTETARYDYGGKALLTAAFGGKNTLLVFGESGRAQTDGAILLGEKMQALTAVTPGIDVCSAALGEENFYLLGPSAAVGYDFTGAETCRQALTADGLRVVCAKVPLAVTAKEILQLTPLKK